VAKAKKFGAFGGVFTPSILTILGVIMFLRLPWIVGQAGLWSTLGIILLAHIISASTGLSVSSAATDKQVGTGGSYYIISRSLGLSIGGTLGIALFIGLSFSVSLYLIGFAETFLSYFGFIVTLQNIRIAGSVILFLVTVVTFISTSLAIKTQYLIMTAMGLSLLSIFFGNHEFSPAAPLLSPMAGSMTWIALFAIFFPAVTGFEAGVSMSGDLKNPRKHIPLGTVSAILVGFVVYVGLAFFFSYTIDRDMLVNDPRVLFKVSFIPQLVIAGILGATLSSALGSILGAPRILRAVALDRILPGFFSRSLGVSEEPRNALLLTFLIAQAGILIGELNVIARIVTIFFIITYGFLNITYAVESWAGSDFRPSFRIPRFVSIIGALACIIVMIQLDLIALIVASILLFGLFLFLKKKELNLQTGDTWSSIWASLVKTGLGKLTSGRKKGRDWRPNVILFSGGEKNRPHLVEMGKALVGKLGIFTNFELIESQNGENLFGKLNEQEDRLRPRDGIFTRRHECKDIYEGIDTISRVYGFSGFEPNMVLMGWARNTRKPDKFATMLHGLKKQELSTALLSYDKIHGFGQYRSIDVWWSGQGRNLSLAITLLRFITAGKEWRGARIRILVINTNSSRTDALYSLIRQMLENYRLTADVKVINNGVEQLPVRDIIHAESRHTDLNLMEMPSFEKNEAARIVNETNMLTEGLHSCLLISASSFFEEVNTHLDKRDADLRVQPLKQKSRNHGC
jgi:amino acid transporter